MQRLIDNRGPQVHNLLCLRRPPGPITMKGALWTSPVLPSAVLWGTKGELDGGGDQDFRDSLPSRTQSLGVWLAQDLTSMIRPGIFLRSLAGNRAERKITND